MLLKAGELQEQQRSVRSVSRIHAREADRRTCRCLVEEGLGHFDVSVHSDRGVSLPGLTE